VSSKALPGHLRGTIRPRSAAGPRCKICRDPRLHAISAALASGRSERSVAREYGFRQALMNVHVREHMGEALAQYNMCVPVLQQIRRLHARTLAILDEAERAQDPGIALQAVRECRGNLQLLARLTGELRKDEPPQEPTTVKIRYVDVPLPGSREAGGAAIEVPAQRPDWW
jgi:hypothetical protein